MIKCNKNIAVYTNIFFFLYIAYSKRTFAVVQLLPTTVANFIKKMNCYFIGYCTFCFYKSIIKCRHIDYLRMFVDNFLLPTTSPLTDPIYKWYFPARLWWQPKGRGIRILRKGEVLVGILVNGLAGQSNLHMPGWGQERHG